ncbi:MAG: hypothetical protein DWQ01_22680 [Planctomycetota bacterium]|nr:MAG: hypothetical protein DWQ01_22680 [Planctomycetota bacterium]
MRQLLTFGLLLCAILASGACSSGSNPASGQAAAGKANFSINDVKGDWLAILEPDSPSGLSTPFYLRVDSSGTLFRAADGRGNEWRLADSVTSVEVKTKGSTRFTMTQTGGEQIGLQLTGTLTNGGNVHSGQYVYEVAGVPEETGSYQATFSSGEGHFTVADQLAKSWSGTAYLEEIVDINVQIDAGGTVTGGNLDTFQYLSGGVNTGIWQFFDDKVGRIGPVNITDDSGYVTSLWYVLVDENGSLMQGPGKHTILGLGTARMLSP